MKYLITVTFDGLEKTVEGNSSYYNEETRTLNVFRDESSYDLVAVFCKPLYFTIQELKEQKGSTE